MPAYVVALIQSISDKDMYARYVAQVEATLAPFGGRFIARKPDPAALEGGAVPSRAVILEFPDEAQARAWHASPAYQSVMDLRQSASTGTLLLLPGYAGSPPRVAHHDVCYIEMVTPDVAAMQRVCADVHGWTFAEEDAVLGGARIATLPSGARAAIRAPLRSTETPVTRAYVRVPDVEHAAAEAERSGATVALGPTELAGHGRIAIFIIGGIEHGVWELPRG